MNKKENWEEEFDKQIDNFLEQPYFTTKWEKVYDTLRLDFKSYIKTLLKQQKQKIKEKLKNHKVYENKHNVDDPIKVEIVRIQNIGFENAHELRKCGHSVGDYRDPKYGTPEYDGDEECVGCQSVQKIKEKVLGVKSQPNLDEYLALIEKWDGKDFDVPFDFGYNQALQDIEDKIKDL